MDEQSFRLRVTYAKSGRLAWLSHLELMRAMERTIRRSGLPYALSQGFNQHMRHAFGPALPVGTGGLAEQLDVQLTAYIPPDEALTLLQQVQVPELPVLDACYVPKDAPSLSAVLTISEYLVLLEPPESLPVLQDALAALAQTGVLKVSRKGKAKEYDLNSLLVQWHPVDGGLNITLRATPSGSLRPEKLLDALLRKTGASITGITRTRLYAEEKPN